MVSREWWPLAAVGVDGQMAAPDHGLVGGNVGGSGNSGTSTVVGTGAHAPTAVRMTALVLSEDSTADLLARCVGECLYMLARAPGRV